MRTMGREKISLNIDEVLEMVCGGRHQGGENIRSTKVEETRSPPNSIRENKNTKWKAENDE